MPHSIMTFERTKNKRSREVESGRERSREVERGRERSRDVERGREREEQVEWRKEKGKRKLCVSKQKVLLHWPASGRLDQH